MSHRVKGKVGSPSGGAGASYAPLDAAVEAAVRELIARGHRDALEQAKDLHRQHRTAASEALLLDAYAARIDSLFERNLMVEASALLELVRQRYPSARGRFADRSARAEARAPGLDEIVRPLADPSIPGEERATIERVVCAEIWDVGALGRCEALPQGHSLRVAAAAIDRALVAATSGPVDDAALALPEVSHRSPLASWKPLVRAIACFHRGDDTACRQHLEAIAPESVPARAAPVLRAMLDGDTRKPSGATAALMGHIVTSSEALHSTLRTLDEAFASASGSRIIRAIRAAIQECRRSAPDRLEALQQRIWVRGAILDIDEATMARALGGQLPAHNATFARLLARGMEETGNPEHVPLACAMWEVFRQSAPREGWFPPSGVEATMIYLHMAELLERLPIDVLRDLQHSVSLGRNTRGAHQEGDRANFWFLFPEQLYQRAAGLDPGAETFAKWLAWTLRATPSHADSVAEAWHKAQPLDLQPLLHLMNSAERRSAFQAALSYQRRAARIDTVHPRVRGAHVRLLAASVRQRLRQKKLRAAEAEVAALGAVPQAHQGDRPAALAALRYFVAAVRDQQDDAASHRADVERLLGSRAAAAMLLGVIAADVKPRAVGRFEPVDGLGAAERAVLPAALAQVAALAADLQMSLTLPPDWMAETAEQFGNSRQSLDVDQLCLLGGAALSAGRPDFAFAVSAAGLERDGATGARFLLLRARALLAPAPRPRGGRSTAPRSVSERGTVCAAAAAALARQQRDLALVDEAVDLNGVRRLLLTVEQAASVLEKERAHAAWPAGRQRGPDYRALLDPVECQCPDCRRARGEAAGSFEDLDEPFDGLDDSDEDLDLDLPPDMPPALAAELMEEIRSAIARGESPDEFIARLRGGRTRRRARKGRRK